MAEMCGTRGVRAREVRRGGRADRGPADCKYEEGSVLYSTNSIERSSTRTRPYHVPGNPPILPHVPGGCTLSNGLREIKKAVDIVINGRFLSFR